MSKSRTNLRPLLLFANNLAHLIEARVWKSGITRFFLQINTYYVVYSVVHRVPAVPYLAYAVYGRNGLSHHDLTWTHKLVERQVITWMVVVPFCCRNFRAFQDLPHHQRERIDVSTFEGFESRGFVNAAEDEVNDKLSATVGTG